jgi:hypothetical protein
VVRESNAHLRAVFLDVLNREFVPIGIEPVKTLNRGAEADAHLQVLDAIGGDARAIVGDGEHEAIGLKHASDLNATGNRILSRSLPHLEKQLLREVDGILGADLLTHRDAVALDHKHREMRLGRTSCLTSDEEPKSLSWLRFHAR